MSNASNPAAAPAARPAAVAFIFITIVLDILALGLIIPVLPTLVQSLSGTSTADAALIFGTFGTAFAAMQFIFSPVQGVLSDRFGRRPVILLSNLGLGFDYLLMALAPTVGWLFVGRILSGITTASISTATAYIADVTPPEKRAAAFGMIGGAFGLGFVLGPALGGYLGSIDPRLPFWVAAALSIANFAYGYFILPESLPPERRTPFSLARANPFGSLAFLKARPEITRLVSINFLGFLAHEILPSVTVLYVGHRYGWTPMGVGGFLAAVGVASALTQAVLVRHAVALLGERATMIIGLLCGTVGFSIYALAPTGNLFWLGLPFMALWGMAGPATTSLMTARVGPEHQGELQGALGSLRGISGMIGPGIYTATFAAAIGSWQGLGLPGLAFLLAAALIALAAVLGWTSSDKALPR
jgi:MFS transporter, DHA1 family, tetracycline resistance protein